MSFASQSAQPTLAFASQPFRLKRWLRSCLIGVGASVLLGTSAHAADRIILTYQDVQTTVPVSAIANFATTGQVSGDLQELFQKYPRIQQVIRDLLTREIRVSPSFVERTLKSSTGEFVLIQLDKLINTSSAGADIEMLRNTLVEAYQDNNAFSLLEVLERFPVNDIRVDLTSLERVYTDVSTFVERIQPALEVAREFLQNYICDCKTPNR
ncbi:alpha/beta hydrolase [Pantanalinema rosaneae CENA516]|uniref:alpha/beta hydrolase n=1 Tax=Pantanalinema rosaneae TaxID=1620701 RepID=UPI003D6E3D27